MAHPIAPLLRADIPGAERLVAQAGWNQVAADWELFIELGAGFKVVGDDGTVIATAAILPSSASFGWISMVLVDTAHRRRGLATQLLQACIEKLQAQQRVPALDATPAGREVYRPLGFRDGWAITRWRAARALVAPQEGAHAVKGAHAQNGAYEVRPLRDEDWPAVRALDAPAFGGDRGTLLARLASRSREFACVAVSRGRVEGFLLGRDGRSATQLGPIVATNEDCACALLAHALTHVEGPVLVDALARHEAFARQLTAAGFAVERGYTRMALGGEGDFGDDNVLIAIAGPELG
ncbi:GNAT family N-acetyltransferase [Ramlibacter albus]|uniref:GNAT family N-acetyltransferase n=1 Tax=Ramlibacter albus TaxID=2079448 RepID=A0A923S555_9BURK|nr:GNAT family N-acetyltransferase [Ramlibacter albus]MBC5768215.1 GNAT family N-acetyltransferase [Ramlibacter albus]